MDFPALIVTGATGFLGRHLLAELKGKCRIYAISRRAGRRFRAPDHPDIQWFHVDIGDTEALAPVFRRIEREGGARAVVHLAAYYDFTGIEHPDYHLTNVVGTRNVLELCRRLSLQQFLFASSMAACRFPPPGGRVDEDSPPHGDHYYALSKRRGEEMLAEYAGEFPSRIMRFGALFSDWCEYPPLYFLLRRWLSGRWDARFLGGRGETALPYLHVREAVSLVVKALERGGTLSPGEVLNASMDGAVSHLELYEAAMRAACGMVPSPFIVPKPLCRAGIAAREALGLLTGDRPFERWWMGDYIDRKLPVDASRTRSRLGWVPRQHLGVLRRVPAMVGNCLAEPAEWARRNRAILQKSLFPTDLRVLHLPPAPVRRPAREGPPCRRPDRPAEAAAAWPRRFRRFDFRWK